MRDLNEAIKKAKEYFKDTPPKNVVEYMKNYPKGLSRTMLKTYYGVTTAEFVKLLNPEYENFLDEDAFAQLTEVCKQLGLRPILPDGVTDTSYKKKKHRVITECLSCNYKNETTWDSLKQCSKGCRICGSGNAPWSSRKEELELIIKDRLEGILISNIPDNQYLPVTIRCNHCSSQYSTSLVGVVSPQTKLRATCPNCRPTDRRVVHEGVTFHSQFELDVFMVLNKLPGLRTSVYYKEEIETSRRWVCDFVFKDFLIEASSFKPDYKNYFQNLEDKKSAVLASGKKFVFISSLQDAINFVKDQLNKI